MSILNMTGGGATAPSRSQGLNFFEPLNAGDLPQDDTNRRQLLLVIKHAMAKGSTEEEAFKQASDFMEYNRKQEEKNAGKIDTSGQFKFGSLPYWTPEIDHSTVGKSSASMAKGLLAPIVNIPAAIANTVGGTLNFVTNPNAITETAQAIIEAPDKIAKGAELITKDPAKALEKGIKFMQENPLSVVDVKAGLSKPVKESIKPQYLKESLPGNAVRAKEIETARDISRLKTAEGTKFEPGMDATGFRTVEKKTVERGADAFIRSMGKSGAKNVFNVNDPNFRKNVTEASDTFFQSAAKQAAEEGKKLGNNVQDMARKRFETIADEIGKADESLAGRQLYKADLEAGIKDLRSRITGFDEQATALLDEFSANIRKAKTYKDLNSIRANLGAMLDKKGNAPTASYKMMESSIYGMLAEKRKRMMLESGVNPDIVTEYSKLMDSVEELTKSTNIEAINEIVGRGKLPMSEKLNVMFGVYGGASGNAMQAVANAMLLGERGWSKMIRGSEMGKIAKQYGKGVQPGELAKAELEKTRLKRAEEAIKSELDAQNAYFGQPVQLGSLVGVPATGSKAEKYLNEFFSGLLKREKGEANKKINIEISKKKAALKSKYEGTDVKGSVGKGLAEKKLKELEAIKAEKRSKVEEEVRKIQEEEAIKQERRLKMKEEKLRRAKRNEEEAMRKKKEAEERAKRDLEIEMRDQLSAKKKSEEFRRSKLEQRLKRKSK